MASEADTATDLCVAEKELSIPGEDKRLDTKEDGKRCIGYISQMTFFYLPVAREGEIGIESSETRLIFTAL